MMQRPDLLAPVRGFAILPHQFRFSLQRRYNTLSLLDHYLGHGKMSNSDIAWSAADPNLLSMTLPGGLDVTTRVTRRSKNESPPDRLDTSEYFQQVGLASETPGIRTHPPVALAWHLLTLCLLFCLHVCCCQSGARILPRHWRLITASPVPAQISGRIIFFKACGVRGWVWLRRHMWRQGE